MSESIATQQYVRYQEIQGLPDISVTPCGFHVCKSHPFLGASPDGAASDPTEPTASFRFLEVKCPYMYWNITPQEPCATSGFCCSLESESEQLVLCANHPYYAQIQGQMAIGGRE